MKYVFVIIALIALGAQALKADQRASQTLQDMVEAQALIRMPNVSVDDTKGAGAAAAASKVDETTDTGAATAASKVDETTDTGASKDTGSTDAGASKEDDVQGAEIPPKVSVDETTGAGAAAAASKKGWVLDILTDFGEETDDEVAVTAACLIALTDNTMQLNIMFLDEDPTAQKKKLGGISRP